ncbi:MAG: DUF6843 domain-containing protein [Imperialibacter sp.]|uniref:DUF6843 domain-containing protein n=1 Tax=Imperialibacter sp. TaxID=2038411 RepID=UPI003A87CAEE
MLAKNVVPKVVIVVGFLICINLYWLIIGGPICILGIIYLLLQKRSIRSKILWTLWPPLLVYPAFLVFIYVTGVIGTATAQKLEFRFPKDFRGTAVVIPNMDCGQEVITEDGREILNFPEHGILLYRGRIEYGYINHVYRIYDSTGDLVDLPELIIQEFNSEPKQDTTELGVFYNYAPTMAKEIPSGNGALGYTVSTYEQIQPFYEFQNQKKLERAIDSLILSCKR